MRNFSEMIVTGDTVRWSKVCSVTNERYIVEVPKELVNRWHSGELIQNVFPMLNADQREFLMTGTTPAEWDKAFEGLD